MLPNNWIEADVKRSLAEDVGSGDITVDLIKKKITTDLEVITHVPATLCGIPCFNEVYRQIDPNIQIQWKVKEGDPLRSGQHIVSLQGNARSLLTGERCALNWLQFLSSTATQTAHCVKILKNTHVKLLDTRKTIPGLREAQKYAVRIGGGYNHRMGLYDAYLIKENHIASCGSIKQAIAHAKRQFPDKPVQVEVENFSELQEAIQACPDRIMLDNFTLAEMKEAVSLTTGKIKLEVSGNITHKQLPAIAKTGIDYISMGSLTKNICAIDLSMRFVTKKHAPINISLSESPICNEASHP